ncbi:hypothetical protein WA158_007005 [Blastocystis sp. Blastoise]
METENVILNIDQFDHMNKDSEIYGEWLKNAYNVFSSVVNFGVLSGKLIDIFINQISSHIQKKETYHVFFDNNTDEYGMNHQDYVNSDYCSDEDNDVIQFVNNGTVFKVSKSILDHLKGSFIEESCEGSCRTKDGTIFLDYRADDASPYYLLNYLNGVQVDFNSLGYEEQLCILNLFEYCLLPIPEELVNCRERRDMSKKEYKQGSEVNLIINGKKDNIVHKYLIASGHLNDFIHNYDHGYVNSYPYDDSTFISMNYQYIQYIHDYINNGYITIDDQECLSINQDLLETEMLSLSIDKAKEIVCDGMIRNTVFIDSQIIETRKLETPLVNWLGKEKKWKLLFRASEHYYLVSEFHKYCDNKGETVTLIKHIGHNNHINIFGGYTDQNWTNFFTDNLHSNEFLFTISNEHDIPPTQYLHDQKSRATYCSPNQGPVFGAGADIAIYDLCHDNNMNYCKAHSFEQVLTNQKSSLFVNTDDSTNINYFKVEDYEVWGRI